MLRFLKRINKSLSKEGCVISANREAVNERNIKLLQLILLGCMFIFGTNLILTYFVESFQNLGYAGLRSAYLALIAISFTIYSVIKLNPEISSFWAIYAVYAVAVTYCVYTSAFVSPNYICVVILAVLFQIPIMYIDKSYRINIYVMLCGAVYLTIISFYKAPRLVTDEIINVFAFSATSIIIGSFTRASILENFAIKNTLQAQAYTDQLTGLSNRRKLFEDLKTATDKKSVSGAAIIDIDHFKLYNDTYGHQAGDACLRLVSGCFKDFEQRHGTVFYRYGGEEFVVLFLTMPCERMAALCEELCRCVADLKIEHCCSVQKFVTASIGLASFDEAYANAAIDDDSADIMLSNADKALYSAKADGRNRLSVYAPAAASLNT